MKVPKLNRRLLRRVKETILAQPARLNMNSYKEAVDKEDGGPECETQACIGGWAVLLGERVPKGQRARYYCRNWGVRARTLLGLTKDEAEQMFYAWSYDKAHGRKGAKEAAKKIDLLLEDRDTFVEKVEKLTNG